MTVLSWVLACAAGIATGIISAWGIGGGTLLVLYMAAFTKIEQRMAQGINLIYFIPVAIASLVTHIKNELIMWKAAAPAILAGLPCAVGLSFAASGLESGILRRIFGVFVICVGLFELFAKDKENQKQVMKQQP